MNIGLEFDLNSLDDYTILGKILSDDFLQEQSLFWRIDCLSLWYGEMQEGIFSSKQLSTILQTEIMIDTIRICGFHSKESATTAPILKTYDEYVNSQCVLIIRCIDSYYFDLYTKDQKVLKKMMSICCSLNCKKFKIINEENNSLTSLLAY